MLTIEKQVSLQPYNTFRVAAQAAQLVRLQQVEDLFPLLDLQTHLAQPKLILGGGSNILFQNNFPGLVIKNEIKGLETVEETPQHIYIKIGAGENWHQFVLYCVSHQYGGIENLSLIPGTVGAAPMQNIGAYGVELKNVFHSLHAIDLETGETTEFHHTDCQFDYRSSIFKTNYKNRFIITDVTLRLDKQPNYNIEYGALKKTLSERQQTPSIASISEAVIQIRQSKLPNPSEIPNAGSFFKNPIISESQFKSLQTNYPDAPHFALEGSKIKIPAAWLIEQCGWKGKQRGEVGVHTQQALVLVNLGEARGQDLVALAEDIQKSVHTRFGIQLQPEVNIV